MVKKRTPLARIEKVVRKKRTEAENSPNSSPKRVRSMLSDNILSLYKNEVPSKEGSPSNEELLNCADEKQKDKNVINKITAKSESSSNEEVLSYGDKGKEGQTTAKSKCSTKNEAGSIKKKSSAFGLKHSEVRFKDVGGFDDILMRIFYIFSFNRNPRLLTSLGVKPSGGFLLYGPPGCGKTHIARAVAGEFNLPYIEVAATELVCGISGESEGKIREMFEEAMKNAPCILFIDEIDAICPKRETSEKGMEKRMVAQMTKCLDELNEMDISSSVVVIGATNRPDSIDDALRRGLRFDTEFNIGMPDETARLKILEVLFKNLKLSPDFDMQWLAHHTPGSVGADLKSLMTKGVKIGIQRINNKYINQYKKDNQEETSQSGKPEDEPNLETVLSWYKSNFEIPEEEFANICFHLSDFQKALKDYVPYAKREGFAMIPGITWDDVGALTDIKEELKQSIIWPVKYRELYENSGFKSSGILMYGLKGCGKTLLAKAMANECSINFLSVKGPELLSMYLGESEKAVRQCFERARNSAPCVIFFDEFDALCPNRSGSNHNAAAERVVNQLLIEMDGVEDRKQVFVIGATNRLNKIDKAMLRGGRLEKIIFVDLPSQDDRYEILISLTKNKTKPKIADDVDLKEIADDARCENFSGADLASLIHDATKEAMKDHIRLREAGVKSMDIVEIKKQHFDRALSDSSSRPSVSLTEIQEFKKEKRNFLDR